MSSEKEIFAKMFINDKEMNVHNPIKIEFNEAEDSMTITFMIGKSKLDKVKLVFEEMEYVDGEEEKTTDN